MMLEVLDNDEEKLFNMKNRLLKSDLIVILSLLEKFYDKLSIKEVDSNYENDSNYILIKSEKTPFIAILANENGE